MRNLWITTAYHDLASALTHGLGATNLSWCAFAAWASKTAGISIRADHLRGFARSAVSRSEEFRHVLEVLAERVPDDVEAAIEDALLAVVDDVVDAVSERVARGNLMVFEELAPLFARLVVTLGDPSAHAAFLDSVVAIDRLNYILNLFRSWQQRPQLLQAPFTMEQLRDLEDARIPPEPL